MEDFIPLSVPNLKGRELELVSDAVNTEWVSTGPYIPEFERVFASYTGVQNAVAVQSGTAALHLAYIESGIRGGDMVIVPDLTFAATVNPLAYIGAEPVFIDCDDSLCMDVHKLRSFCENECVMRDGELLHKGRNKRVRAVVPVHIFGNLADMREIMDIAREFSLRVIEDACEALGSFWTAGPYEGRHSGTVGDIAVFSFNGNKIVTTGGGGMILAKDETELNHMRYLSTQSKNDELRFIHDEVGYNYRLTNVQAALGIAQMEKLPEFLIVKKRNYELYRQEGLELLSFLPGVSPNYWFYSLMTHGKRDHLMGELAKRHIQSRPIWELMHRLKPFADCIAYQIERAAFYHSEIVNIPCSTNLSETGARRVAAAIKDILE